MSGTVRPAGFSSDEDDFSDDDLSFGDSPPTQRRNWYTPMQEGPISKEKQLINAVEENNYTEVEKLLQEGVNVRTECGPLTQWDGLMYACSLGHANIVKLLLDHGANPNCHFELFTPIMAVCDSVRSDESDLLVCFEALVKSGADINAQDWYKITPLMYAVKRGHRSLIMKFLSAGVDVNKVDKDGWSPLFYAVDSGNLKIVQLLKDTGGDISLIDKRGRTLYDVAIMKDFKEISEIVCTKEKVPTIEEVVEKKREEKRFSSTYQFILSELPDKKKGRFFGFPTDAIKIIHGTGLNHLTPLFLEKDIQLGELLTYSDKKWEELGIAMSFDRAKIRYCVQKFHERHWGKLSLGAGTTTENITLFLTAQILSTVVRQLYVLSTTTYYLCINAADKTNGIKKYAGKAFNHIELLEEEINLLSKLVKKMNREQNIIPADLIKPKQKRKWYKHVLIVPAMLCGFVFYIKYIKKNV